MANIKLTGNTWDTSSVYDKTEGKTQKQINAALASAVSSQAEETTELKTAITVKNVLSGEVVQGSYNQTGLVTTSSTRIRYKDYIKVEKGDVISFTAGTNAQEFFVGYFSTAQVFITDGSWKSTTDINVTSDGYVIITFRKSNNADITPSEYDAETAIIKKVNIESEQNKQDIDTCFKRKNLVGNDPNIYYPVNIPASANSVLTMSTKDHKAIGVTSVNLRFYDENKYDISSGGYNFSQSVWKRTITWNPESGKTAYYLKWTNVPRELQVEYGSVVTDYEDYTVDIQNDTVAEAILADERLVKNYEDSMHDIVSDFCDKTLEASSGSELFLFYTDPHLAVQLGSNSGIMQGRAVSDLNFIQGVYDSSPLSFFLCGGDWLGNSDTQLKATEKLSYIDGFMREKFKNYLPIVGNHDTNYQGATGSKRIDADILKNYWQKFREEQKMYYLFKAPTCNIYVFDTEVENDELGSYYNEQIDWFATALTTDNHPHIVISMHCFYVNTIASGVINALTDKVFAAAQAYNARSTFTNDGNTYDFSASTGKVSFCIAGHTHRDVQGTYKDIPYILSMDGTAQGAQETGDSDERLCTFNMCIADWDKNELYMKRVGYGTDKTLTIL